MEQNSLEKIVSWAKRRGFVMQGSEIYGGVNGIYNLSKFPRRHTEVYE